MKAQRLSQRGRIQLLQAGTVLALAAVLLTQPMLVGRTHEFIEMAGLSLAIFCVAGRAWSSLYIGAKKNRELVTAGPYSMTRNPLYFFSTIGAVGVGLMFGSIAIALLLGLGTCGVLIAMAKKESRHLQAIFGDRYEVYARQTPMFWPKCSLYQDVQEMTFSPKALRRTFLDGTLFILVFPVIEITEKLKNSGALPVLMRVF